jgi:uncharacterized protein YoxC
MDKNLISQIILAVVIVAIVITMLLVVTNMEKAITDMQEVCKNMTPEIYNITPDHEACIYNESTGKYDLKLVMANDVST